MDPSDAPRGRLGRLSARLQRLVFTPALLALCGILFLGSLPDEIRPAALDRASAASDRLLARLGTRAGC